MPYSAMPSRLMPMDADGTVVGQSIGGSPAPVTNYPSGADLIAWIAATSALAVGGLTDGSGGVSLWTYCFFPELRTVLGLMGGTYRVGYGTDRTVQGLLGLAGSANSTNGSDGTWESASFPGGLPTYQSATGTTWRDSVAALTFTAAKSTVRTWGDWSATQSSNGSSVYGGTGSINLGALHVYGVKYAGQTPDDILFLDGDIAFAEYTVDKDFGDRPLGTTVVKQFKLKNSSTTKTATTILVTCNDTDFAISNDGVTYGTTFTISSLGPGVSSVVLYIRNTTPAPGAALGPRMARLSAAVGSYV